MAQVPLDRWDPPLPGQLLVGSISRSPWDRRGGWWPTARGWPKDRAQRPPDLARPTARGWPTDRAQRPPDRAQERTCTAAGPGTAAAAGTAAGPGTARAARPSPRHDRAGHGRLRASSCRGSLPSPRSPAPPVRIRPPRAWLSWPIPSVKPRSRVSAEIAPGSASTTADRAGPPSATSADRGPRSRTPEELGKAAVRLEVPPDHHRVVGLERLRHAIDQRSREPERHSHLAHDGSGSVGDDVADHPGVLGSVALVDVLDDLLPSLGREVDVDVRVGRPALVDEPLEQEVVADRVDPGDPQDIGHDRVGRAPSTLGRDPAGLGEAHQVPADQEELGQAGPLDDLELVGELADDRRGHRVVAPPGALVTQLGEIGERRLPARHRKAREAVRLEPEVDLAGGGELAGRRDPLRPGPGGPRIVAGRRRCRQGAGPSAPRRTSGRTRRRSAGGRPASRPTGRGGSP